MSLLQGKCVQEGKFTVPRRVIRTVSNTNTETLISLLDLAVREHKPAAALVSSLLFL
jgi:hypothetical protein